MQTITADVFPMYSLPEADAQSFIKWVYGVRKEVSFDMDVIGYPRACMTRAKMADETVAMIPLQPVLMFESLVRKPELTTRQTAMCMWKIGEVVKQAMNDTGHKEAYFITNSEPEVEAVKARGWIVVLHDAERGQWLMKLKTAALAYPLTANEAQ